ncbi:hypothetical protein KC957_03195 [Candidatus Saccharibacteria bacterium]|nr:hypothetical protein [Candidatus Saccharibacteria bacterium]
MAEPTERPPTIVGAGFAKLALEATMLAEEQTLAAQTLGSYSIQEWHGYRGSTTAYWDAATGRYFNVVNLENPGSEQASGYLPETVKRIKDAGQYVLISVVALKHEDPHKVLPRMAEWALEMGADEVEINGSCPSQSPDHPLLCFDVDETMTVVDGIRCKIGPSPRLALKMAPMDADLIHTYAQSGLGVNTIVTTNTHGNQRVPTDPRTGTPFIKVNQGLAGVSGPHIAEAARANLVEWLKSPFDVISLGGVTDGAEIAYRERIGAKFCGGVQELHRATNPRRVIQRWAQEYVDAV